MDEQVFVWVAGGLILAGCAGAPIGAEEAEIGCSTSVANGVEIWVPCDVPICGEQDCQPLTEEQLREFKEEQPREEYEEGGA